MRLSKKFVRLGRVAVDSGQLVLTDPAYLKEWKNNDFNDIVEQTLYQYTSGSQKGEKIWLSPADYLKHLQRKKLSLAYKSGTENARPPKRYVDQKGKVIKADYSYTGACLTTLSERQGGGFGDFDSHAVAFSTGWGDGEYPVYAEIRNGRVRRIEVVFFDDENDLVACTVCGEMVHEEKLDGFGRCEYCHEQDL